jgi:hypothetical protein
MTINQPTERQAVWEIIEEHIESGNGDVPQVEQKSFDDKSVGRSVVDYPPWQERGGFNISPIIFNMALNADEFPAWGVDISGRDKELRAFWHTEPTLASAVYGVSIRNAGMSWRIIGADPKKDPPVKTIKAVETILRNSNRGQGWLPFVVPLMVDLYTQDNGGFIEVIRAEDRPDSPVWNLAHLDAQQCLRTGDPDYPVIYTDRLGVERVLKWYQVIPISEFPSPYEQFHGVQYCAVTRALLAAQILRDIAIYKHEKVSGRFSRSVHIVSGISGDEIRDSIAITNQRADNSGQYRYIDPVIATSIDPTQKVDHVQIDLASLPDAFDEEATMKWYIAQLAMAFGVDYQEFAPLPGGNLGAGGQSQILHMKTRGKGPAIMMRLIQDTINYSGILPTNVLFQYDEMDLSARKDEAEARFTRGKDRSLRVKSGEIDMEAAREMAVKDGDLPEHLVDDITVRQEELEQQGMQQETPNEMNSQAENVEGGTASHEERLKMLSDEEREAALRRRSSWGSVDNRHREQVLEIDVEAARQNLIQRLGG